MALLDQEETDHLWDAVIEDLHHDVEVSVQSLLYLTDEEGFWVVVGVGCFLCGEGSTERSSSRAERYLLSLVKTVPI